MKTQLVEQDTLSIVWRSFCFMEYCCIVAIIQTAT